MNFLRGHCGLALCLALLTDCSRAGALGSDSDARPLKVSALSPGAMMAAIGQTPMNDTSADPDRYVCDDGVNRVDIGRTGEFVWVVSTGGRVSGRFPAPQRKVQQGVDVAWCGFVDGDLVLVHGSTWFGPHGDFLGGGVVRVTSSKGILWSTAIDSGNVGPPLLNDGMLYVSALGWVGKLDLRTGQYLWRQVKLFRSPGLFNAFAQPRREGARIVFPAKNSNYGKQIPPEWPRELVIDDASGRIVAGTPKE